LTRKILAKTPSGTDGVRFGGEDTDYVNQLLTGVDESASDPVDINTLWKFRSGKLQLLKPGASGTPGTSTNEVYIVNGSAITSDKTVSLPLLTSLSSDSFAFDISTQTFTNKTFPGGSAATEGSNNYIGDIYTYPAFRKSCGYIGGSQTAAIGYGQGQVGNAGTPTHGIGSTGKYLKLTTATGPNTQAGWKQDITAGAGIGDNPTLACKFKINASTTAYRFGIGWININAYPTTGSDDPLATSGLTGGAGLFKRSTDTTNVVIGHKGSNGTSVYDSTSPSIAIDTTNPHIFRIKADNASSSFQYSWDNGSYVSLPSNNDYPTTTTLSLIAYIETSESATKDFDLYWLIGDSQEFP